MAAADTRKAQEVHGMIESLHFLRTLTGEIFATYAMKDSLSRLATAWIFLVELVLNMGSDVLILLEFVHSLQADLHGAFFVTAGHVAFHNFYTVRLQQVGSCQRLLALFLLLGVSHHSCYVPAPSNSGKDLITNRKLLESRSAASSYSLCKASRS